MRLSRWPRVFAAKVFTSSCFILLILSRSAFASVLPSVDLDQCIDEYYNFEFAEAATCFNRAYLNNGTDLRTIYWYTKSIWVNEVDKNLNLNSDMVGFILDKEPERRTADPALRSKFVQATSRGLSLGKIATTVEDKYYVGGILGNRTAWDMLIEGNKVAALTGVKQTMKQMQECLKVDPHYADTYSLLGMGNYLLGTNPWYLKFITFVLGASGDKSLGIQQLKQGVDAKSEDARFLYKGVLVRERRYAEATVLLEDLLKAFPRNIYYAIEIGDLYIKISKQDRARYWYRMALSMVARNQSLDSRVPAAEIRKRLQSIN